jgi:hypothetical protein
MFAALRMSTLIQPAHLIEVKHGPEDLLDLLGGF